MIDYKTKINYGMRFISCLGSLVEFRLMRFISLEEIILSRQKQITDLFV